MLGSRPAAGSWFGLLIMDLDRDEDFAAHAPDAPRADDDPAIFAWSAVRRLGSRRRPVASRPRAGDCPPSRGIGARWIFTVPLPTARLGARTIDFSRLSPPALARRGGRGETGPGRGAWRRLRPSRRLRGGRSLARAPRSLDGGPSRDGKIGGLCGSSRRRDGNFYPAGPFVAA